SCPSKETFAALAFGRSEDIDTTAFFIHLEQCEPCRRAWYALARAGAPVLGARQGVEPARSVTLPFNAAAAGSAAAVPSLERGALVGRYVVLDRLGGGGMGVVYSAFDPELGRKLAIKLL